MTEQEVINLPVGSVFRHRGNGERYRMIVLHRTEDQFLLMSHGYLFNPMMQWVNIHGLLEYCNNYVRMW